MTFKINKIATLTITFIILGIAFIIFAVKIVMNSLQSDTAEYKTELVKSEAKIYRNDYGIPHIITDSEQDLYFSLGYAQAEDRLWQMDYLRRLAKGELAEIFGSNELLYDKFIRGFDLKNLSSQIYRNLGPESRIILQSFASGVNHYIQSHLNKLPVEFSTLDYLPAKWSAEDCIAIFKLFALRNSPGFTNDIAMGEIAEKFGSQRALSLIGEYPKYAPLIYENNTYKSALDSSLKDSNSTVPQPAKPIAFNNSGRSFAHSEANIDNDFFANLAQILPYLSLGSGSTGSNAWAVISTKGNNKFGVMANDPHLPLTNPTQFYQAKLTCSNYNLTGLILCGTPLMLIGRNDNISWGIANSMADDFDYFIETIDEKKPDFYLSSDSSSARFKYTIDTVNIKNQPIHTYYKRATSRSMIISDYHLNNFEIPKDKPKNAKASNNYYRKYCIGYNWAGNTNYDDIEHIYHIARSKNWDGFLQSVRKVHSPAFNFVFSDKSGNIAMATGGHIPTRNEAVNSTIPLIRDKYTNWTGYISESEMPYILNPERLFVAAANNKLFSTRFAAFSKYWDNPSRAIRLDSLLKNAFRYSYRDAQLMQSDLFSPMAEKITKQLRSILISKYSELSVAEKGGLERLKKWDFRMMPTFPSSMIFNEFYKNLLRNVFLDELGERYFAKYMLIRNYASNKLLNILDNPNDPYIKNYRNSSIHDINSLFIVTYKQTIDSLTTRFKSNNPTDWVYGSEHFVEIKHKFAENQFLRPSFVMERFQVGGNGSTLNNLEYDYNSPYQVIIGSACKFVSDMSQQFVYTSIPGGTSGQNYSANYSDQLQLWIFGGYVKLHIGRKVESNYELSTKFHR